MFTLQTKVEKWAVLSSPTPPTCTFPFPCYCCQQLKAEKYALADDHKTCSLQKIKTQFEPFGSGRDSRQKGGCLALGGICAVTPLVDGGAFLWNTWCPNGVFGMQKASLRAELDGLPALLLSSKSHSRKANGELAGNPVQMDEREKRGAGLRQGVEESGRRNFRSRRAPED